MMRRYGSVAPLCLRNVGGRQSSSGQGKPLATPPDLSGKPGVPDFGRSDVYRSNLYSSLVRSLLVFKMCRSRWLVHNGPKLLKRTGKYLGNWLAYETLCKATFFKHFCAGTDEKSIQPVLRRLESVKVGYILDYAAEAEVPLFTHASPLKEDLDMKSLVKRQDLKFKDEAEFDANLNIFIQCIDSARAHFPKDKMCFSAIKFTGLVDPQILARVAAIMLRMRQEWVRLFTSDQHPKHLEDCRVVIGVHTDNRFASRERMLKGLAVVWGKPEDKDLSPEELKKEELKRERFIDYLIKRGQAGPGGDQKPGSENENKVDYLVYTNEVCRAMTTGVVPFELQPMVDTLPSLTDEELTLVHNFKKRCEKVMQRALEKEVLVMVDAEQTFYQMAIDHFVREMQRVYNRGERPYVYNTYQCYLKIAEQRVENDLQRADREGWKWAGKIVRGAYVEQETRTAKEYGYANPIQDSLQETHDAYNACAVKLVNRLADPSKPKSGVLFGTHNLYSLQLITSTLHEKVPEAKDKNKLDIAFGQLYGMTDYLTLPLAQAGYRAFKYVPYGPVKETVEYLSRRAQENGAVAGATLVDTRLIWGEMRWRWQTYVILYLFLTVLNTIFCFYLLPYWESRNPDRPNMQRMQEVGLQPPPEGMRWVKKKNPPQE